MDGLATAEVTPDVLRTSGLNVALNELRKHADASLSAAAKKLVAAYKTRIIALAEAGALPSPTSPTEGPATPSLKRRAADMVSSSSSSADIEALLQPKSKIAPGAATSGSQAIVAPLSTAAPAAGSSAALPSPRSFDAGVASTAKAAAAEIRLALTGDKFRDKVQVRSFHPCLLMVLFSF
jgi:hypothetical protein